ncbi:hypothetical protein GCM10010277_14430 [Streptomyces longisporoflavus]|nr:hypothetical protein GCM10010277_14430 [Streptomyces longisporoflavus]
MAQHHGREFPDAEAQLAKYRQLLDRMEMGALAPSPSRDLIHHLPQELRGPPTMQTYDWQKSSRSQEASSCVCPPGAALVAEKSRAGRHLVAWYQDFSATGQCGVALRVRSAVE